MAKKRHSRAPGAGVQKIEWLVSVGMDRLRYVGQRKARPRFEERAGRVMERRCASAGR